MFWKDLTHEDFHSIDRSLPVLIPVAAIEQHGQHLPVSTDVDINEHFLGNLEQKISKEVLILPVVQVACSEHHMDFLGTLTVSHETLISYIYQLVKSVVHHGFENLILFNSHGGNQGAVQVVAEKVGIELKQVNLVNITWWKLSPSRITDRLSEGTKKPTTGHACEIETSLMLAFDSGRVREEKIEQGKISQLPPWARGDLLNAPKAGLIRTMKEMTANGIYGDPTLASREKGEQITEIILEKMIEIIRDLQKIHRLY